MIASTLWLLSVDARQGEPVPMPDAAFAGKTRFEPVGPVGMIVPWNFPLVTSAWKIAPALAAGCTVVLKTSEFTPLVELAYGDIAQEAELPAGVLNLITGAAEAGAALTRDRRLRKLSFTGSNLVGSKVMAAAAARCLPVSLELGGKSPIVVFADADLDHAVDCIAGGIFFNAGQMCSATSRLIVDASIAPALLGRLAARAKALPIGSPFTQGTKMGPITTRPQFEKMLRFLDQARADRLEPLAGGEGGSDAGGFFMQPSVYADVPTARQRQQEGGIPRQPIEVGDDQCRAGDPGGSVFLRSGRYGVSVRSPPAGRAGARTRYCGIATASSGAEFSTDRRDCRNNTSVHRARPWPPLRPPDPRLR